MPDVRVKRVYDPPEPDDGLRVLVDRIWPRGMTRDRLRADRWLKEAAPSTALRTWFRHDPARWEEFQRRYARELDAKPEVVQELVEAARRGTITLLYAAADRQHNQAVALRAYLLSGWGRWASRKGASSCGRRGARGVRSAQRTRV